MPESRGNNEWPLPREENLSHKNYKKLYQRKKRSGRKKKVYHALELPGGKDQTAPALKKVHSPKKKTGDSPGEKGGVRGASRGISLRTLSSEGSIRSSEDPRRHFLLEGFTFINPG